LPDAGKAALICFFEGYLGVAPSIISAIQRLAERGYRIDVIVRQTSGQFAAPPTMPATVRLFYFRAQNERFKRLQERPGPLGRLARSALYAADAIHFVMMTRRTARGHHYHIAFGIDMFGIIAAHHATRTAAVDRLVYWSLEIYSGHGWSRLPRFAKRLEVQISNKADLVIVQDDNRAAILKANGISAMHTAMVPNAPMGRPVMRERNFLHTLLGLPLDTRIVLHAGMISEMTMSPELAKAAAGLTGPYRLVFHEHTKRDPDEPVLRMIEKTGAGRVVLSLTPVPFHQVDSVFASAFIGLAFYSDSFGPNFSEIGAASGKLAFLLRNGVPVIVNALPSLKRLVDETGCGIAVANPDELMSAIERIAGNYDRYHRGALDCFDNRFDFRPFFDKALQRLAE
jgi:glycosyltransferase involved in cell wall biosynthesis